MSATAGTAPPPCGAPASATGRCWVLGDYINTDHLAPGKYMKLGVDEIARHCLESVAPRFVHEVRTGDLIVAGRAFGTGSSREQAAEVLRHLGVQAVIAQSFAGLFYRNGFNLGLPLLLGPAVVDRPAWGVAQGERAQLELAQARLHLPDSNRVLSCQPIPAHLLTLVGDGGLVPHLRKRIARERLHAASAKP